MGHLFRRGSVILGWAGWPVCRLNNEPLTNEILFPIIPPQNCARAQKHNNRSVTEKKANPPGGFHFQLISECWSDSIDDLGLRIVDSNHEFDFILFFQSEISNQRSEIP